MDGIKLNSVVRFLNKELKIKDFPGDSLKNGLQIKAENNIKKIGLAVDACLDVFKKAKQQKCDLIIVHHGLLWKSRHRHKETTNKRIAYLKQNKISLLAYHLPLDSHSKIGNNTLILDLLNVKNKKRFAKHGFKGDFKKSVNINNLVKQINKKMNTKSFCLLFGKSKVKTIGVISGAWKTGVGDAIKNRLDVYLTGEVQNRYHLAKENKINVIFAGHYSTETFGVRAIGKLLEEKFGIKTVFIKNPTGI